MTSATLTFTDEQRAAINTRQVSVALSAGAGCGKTFVLTERFLAELEPPNSTAKKSAHFKSAQLHELIAITFTDRAAREMRDRIRQKCYDRLRTAPTQRQADYWLGLLRSLDAARVSTIHSFCSSLLRAHAVEAGLDPQFTVMEQSQADTLLAELCEDVFREKLSNKEDELHKKLIELATHFDLQRLQTMVATLINAHRAADFEPWLNRTPQQIAEIWATVHREQVVPCLMQQLEQNSTTLGLIELLQSLGEVPKAFVENRSALLKELPLLSGCKNPAQRLVELREFAKLPSGAKKTWGNELYEQFRDTAKAFRDTVDKIFHRLQFDMATAERSAKIGLSLLHLAQAVQTHFVQRKRELACVDFGDLLVQAHRLLTDPAFRDLQTQLAFQTRLLLVDECQDTDPLQVELIKALCGPAVQDGKLFLVGDYKQSIYRFRGADPSVFRRLQQETPKSGRLPLAENFRSQPAILHFVNALFCDAFAESNGHAQGRSISAYEPLRAKRPQSTPQPAVEFLWAKTEPEKKAEAGTVEEARRLEADFIAQRIRYMIDHQEPLVAQKREQGQAVARAVQYGDIAILFRALSDVQFYEEALRQHDIHYYLVGGHAFYAQQEIYDVVNLLRSLISPADTISLAGVLRSPMFALADETLFWLAQHPQGLAAGLFAEKLPAELEAAQRDRAHFAAATLRQLRSNKDRLSITALLNQAFALTGYDAALLAEFMGERKLANVRKLMEQARAFDRSGVLGLADFIVQLSQFVANMPDEPLAATHPEKTNVVRLMTIHQAKGLEFPVVFVPDLNRVAKHRHNDVAWHAELGPLVKLSEKDKKAGVTGADLFAALNAAEDQAEFVRLLYVATTRAADYLVLSSGLTETEFESPKGPWAKLLAERFNLATGEFKGSLPDSVEYQLPCVKVTTELPAVDMPTQSVQIWHGLDQALSSLLDSAKSQAKKTPSSPNGARRGGDIQPTVCVDIETQLAQPVAVDVAAQRRFSVSRLNGLLQPSADERAALALFTGEDEGRSVASSAGTDLGTLVHQALARVDFANLVAAASGETNQLRDMVNRALAAATSYRTELAESAAELLMRFAHTERARALATAKVVHRELEFLLAWPPEFDAANSSARHGRNETDIAANRYLQGFIDCLYQDAAAQWHLLDYKTNQVSTDAVAALAPQFELQLGVYAMAVEQVLKRPPAELVVHFLRPAKEYRFEWDAARRSQMIEHVNQAINTAVISPAPPHQPMPSFAAG